jgi:antitoxin (DNA-binding transcriptional repressor) of toxin-antitoxin stability system
MKRITINMHQAKTQFSKLIHCIERENETVLVCRHGHPVAEIKALGANQPKSLPAPDPKLAAKLHYNPTEPLDVEDLPEALI